MDINHSIMLMGCHLLVVALLKPRGQVIGHVRTKKGLDSESIHISINGCNNITMQNLILTAPSDSPNTDGIHTGNSNIVNVLHSKIGTGDDCISIGPGTNNMSMDHIVCGHGHGISIGSIGGTPREEGVENIEVKNSVFRNTDNGVRIKAWARPSNATVKNVNERILMLYILQSSGVKISNVKISSVSGTSRNLQALVLDCSPTNTCQNIKLQNINLVYSDKMKKTQRATSLFKHAYVN
ncbi:hypothetical protein SASPL_120641 [Salvia splendens]|uniref:Polygalacturonase n=1 Tax=Salvia splendens TaxID=180675 RepID=A0A8X8ZVE0_SALSN|nr:hypothetical protein SASPL_120641 [Salvia splendens]